MPPDFSEESPTVPLSVLLPTEADEHCAIWMSRARELKARRELLARLRGEGQTA